MSGTEGFFKAMSERGRSRLILIEAPAALTPERFLEISDLAGADELRAGLNGALAAVPKKEAPREELTDILSAAFDRAALAVANGGSEKRYKTAIAFVLRCLAS